MFTRRSSRATSLVTGSEDIVYDDRLRSRDLSSRGEGSGGVSVSGCRAAGAAVITIGSVY